jgi:pimeloyl-ACP methyl ester carboxylesterase
MSAIFVRAILVLAVLVLGACASHHPGGGATLEMEEFMVPAADSGIQLYVRNKRPAGVTRFSSDRIVLFVHGATYPAETAFDLPLDGMSWMDYIARHGYDVYLVDLRGYGKSTRPPQMDEPADRNPPLTTNEDAVRDIAAAADFIRKRRGVGKINLIGWSWGTTLMATYTARNNDKVARLVLYAPQWIRTTPSPIKPGATLGAYRVVKQDDAKARWLKGVPEAKKADLIPPGWFEAWAEATFASDPWGARQNPRLLRAPNGVIRDSLASWGSGKAYYDPSEIRVPTFIAIGEWDQDTPPYMAQGLFPRLVNAPHKRMVHIGEATHTVIMEKNRMQLFHAVQEFLREPPRGR